MNDPLKYNVAEQGFIFKTEWMKMIKFIWHERVTHLSQSKSNLSQGSNAKKTYCVLDLFYSRLYIMLINNYWVWV